MSWCACFFALLALPLRFSAADANQWGHDENGVDKYITRPDIVSPRWEVKIHDEKNIAPGLWFVAPYERIGERKPGGAWIGPHIYDGNGDLIWSGSYMWDDRNIMDFKLSNVRGEDLLTMMLPPDEDGILLDNHYQIVEKVPVGIKGKTLNMHEFTFVEEGKTLLLMKRNVTHATKDQSSVVGYEGECAVMWADFEDIDTTTWETRFKWTSADWIGLEESTQNLNPVDSRCGGGAWDYLHSNALDKFPDEHYLMSARHSDTVYKISKDDGHIIWRLGGPNNDFEMVNGANFSRQHHARVRSQNDTHTIISLFDNSKGEDRQPATASWSRALQLALRTDTDPMTAEVILAFDHPYHEHAWRRGDYQVLPNGNAFICWSEHSLQSEHTPDGKMLWEAKMEPSWIGTYRAFKYEFTGLPVDPPDLYSQAYYHDDENNSTTTTVHVSWNGATEVRNWHLYHSDPKGHNRVRIASSPRKGFETAIQYSGFAAYVVAEGIDKFGGSLGLSKVLKTIPSDNMSTPAVEEELAWLESLGSPSSAVVDEAKEVMMNPVTTFFAGVFATAVVVFVVWRFRQRRAGGWLRGIRAAGNRGGARGEGGRYARVSGADAADYDETKLDDMSSSDGYKGSQERFQLEDSDTEEAGVSGRTPYVR
ncbi:uncharacterized protein LTR77_002241 [Saxophila tyrrhenica]|uniref:ASST-domain-containing protein n=1 Tax=Saxophila tyrrhenica TaxID=1690608 RepID=A0AAV9PL19_9PEZI|nr:hypothetical protein LTR77_002241 [Saxophila tyrrhenica]